MILACIGACAALAGCSPERTKSEGVSQSAPASPAPAASSSTAPVATTATPTQAAVPAKPPEKDTIVKSEEQWRKELSPEQYRILREKGTERAFTGKYWNTKEPGVYRCAGCGLELFKSDAKFDSGCGWPSFDKALAEGKITEHVDLSYGMVRTEVCCARCGGHLGHLFEDGPTETRMRYCINSASIEHEKDAKKSEPTKP